jgi:hypothetical protein
MERQDFGVPGLKYFERNHRIGKRFFPGIGNQDDQNEDHNENIQIHYRE